MSNKPSFSDYYRKVFGDIQKKILAETDESIIGSDMEELTEYYFGSVSLSLIEFDSERQEEFEYKKELRTVRAQEREGVYRLAGDIELEYESVIVSIPVVPNSNLSTILELRSGLFGSGPAVDLEVESDNISFTVDTKGYGFQYDNDEIVSKVNGVRGEITTWIERKNSNISEENAKLRSSIHSFLNERKKKLEADVERLKSLTRMIDIPLKKKEDEATRRIKVDPKPLVKRVKPSPTQPEDYILDRSKVLDIISVIDNQGRQFEKTPETYKCFQEEDLRDVILVNLNALFEGKATGETFSEKGKTDIYLNIDKGNILICECKIWGGKKLYHGAIGQLLDYFTWRSNFGIIITFVRRKNMSNILGEMMNTISQHPSYSSGGQQISESHFMSHHRLGQDDFKNVEFHHLFYNLYSD